MARASQRIALTCATLAAVVALGAAAQTPPIYRYIDAEDRFPVTLYTYACGDVCDKAEALLNRRGVPYTTVNVQDSAGFEKLKKATGDNQVPVLQAGDKLIAKGFSDARWQALLDDAGYPKAPVPRRPQQSLEIAKGAPTQAPAPDPAVPPPAPAPTGPGSGYPKL